MMDFSPLMEHRITVSYQTSGTDSGGGAALTYTTRDTGVACLLNVGGGANEAERFDQQNLIGTVTGATYYTDLVRGDRVTVTAGPGLVGATLRVTGVKDQPGVEMLGIGRIVHFSCEHVV